MFFNTNTVNFIIYAVNVFIIYAVNFINIYVVD